jgi:glycosyltransferase involved in cell wall biosynthesis
MAETGYISIQPPASVQPIPRCIICARGLGLFGRGRSVSLLKRLPQLWQVQKDPECHRPGRICSSDPGWSDRNETLALGHVGSFSEPKNHTFLVKLAVQLKGMSWDFRLVLVGDGALRNTIHGLVESSGVSAQVIFTGLRDDIPEWMNMFDVFLFPSLFEGLGIVVIEAQAAGIPCIVSEHVPGEVDMGLGLVQRQPLDSIEHWTVASEDSRRRRRLDQSEVLRQIANRGYSIRESIKDIAGLYESISASG